VLVACYHCPWLRRGEGGGGRGGGREVKATRKQREVALLAEGEGIEAIVLAGKGIKGD
jgi:hypothetical protein